MSQPVGTIWNHGMMSSIRQDWATPTQLFKMLDQEFHFTLDVCATDETATTAEWFGSGALDRPWVAVERGSVWCNPPYVKDLGEWVEKGLRSAEKPWWQTVVMLLPARTDTQWFHAYCLKGEIRFLRGRLNFDDLRPSRAPFPSMIVIFRPKERG